MSKLTQTDRSNYYQPIPTGDEFLKTPEAANALKVSGSKLEKDRLTGKGPRFYRLPNSRTILYRKSDLDAWVMQGARISTSDRGGTQ